MRRERLMNAAELNIYFRELMPDFDFSSTVDKVIFGDEKQPVDRVLVTWQINNDTIEYARINKFDTIVTHEPTVWLHDNEHEIDKLSPMQKITAENKISRLREAKITVIRNHDCWDHMPEYGIPWSWARFLGIKGKPVDLRCNGCQQKYNITPVSLRVLVTSFTEKTSAIGEKCLVTYGNLNQKITSVGIGTGCFCQLEPFLEMDCAVSIVCDDGSSYWQSISWALEIDHPVVLVSHATSEQPGMMSLADYMSEHLPQIYSEFYLANINKNSICWDNNY